MTKKLIYIGDPMCSWCWGFSPVKQAIEEQAQGRAEISLVVGGLRPFTKDAADEERKTFLRTHWQDVGERTGQPFAYDILERDDFVYDTEPPCRAAVTVRTMTDDTKALAFFAELQYAFYADNLDVTQTDVLTKLAVASGLDGEKFAELFDSEEMRQATLADFERAHGMGVSGFPTVVLGEDEHYAYLTVGYQPRDSLAPPLENWLDKGFAGVETAEA